jgi:hypothetical protein
MKKIYQIKTIKGNMPICSCDTLQAAELTQSAYGIVNASYISIEQVKAKQNFTAEADRIALILAKVLFWGIPLSVGYMLLNF